MIKSYCLKSEMESACNVFDEMGRKGIRSTVETFGTLIKRALWEWEDRRSF